MKSHFHRALSYIKARKEMIDFFFFFVFLWSLRRRKKKKKLNYFVIIATKQVN